MTVFTFNPNHPCDTLLSSYIDKLLNGEALPENHVLLLTNYGNEPYLLGIEVALACGADKICVPYYYFEKGEPDQFNILYQGFAKDREKIYLSKPLGVILKKLLRASSEGYDASSYAAGLLDRQNGPALVDSVRSMYCKLLDSGIDAVSLSGEAFRFQTPFRFALNIGLPLASEQTPTYYVFTDIMSQVYSTFVPGTAVHPQKREWLEKLAAWWADIEATFAARFIPKIHPLSYIESPPQNVVFTPPLAGNVELSYEPLDQESILVIPSGTGLDLEKLKQLLDFLPEQYRLVTYSRFFTHPLVKYVNTAVFRDPNLIMVLSRGGWGTIWKCMIYNKLIGYINTSFDQDPEISHTQKTLEYYKIGFCVDRDAGCFPAKNDISAMQKVLRETIQKEHESFGSYQLNGIAFVSDQIKKAIQ